MTYHFDMYVEVYYLKNKSYVSRKMQEYKKEEIEVMFKRTIGKMMTQKTESMVCMRDDNHDLIKTEMVS